MRGKERLQMLVSAVEENTLTLADRMHLECGAVIVNQCFEQAMSTYEHNASQILCLNRKERGVGLSRNLALEKAGSELCLFADEDIVYREGYAQVVIDAFDKNEKADLILFNVQQSAGRQTYHISKKGRVHWYNYGRYPAYAIAARTKSLKATGVKFSTLFGGGAPFSNGEDSLFLRDCLKAGLRIYRVPKEIGEERARESTWFHGYTDRFFHDRGVLYHFLYGAGAFPLSIRFLLKNRKKFPADLSFFRCLYQMREGIRRGKQIEIEKKTRGKVS